MAKSHYKPRRAGTLKEAVADLIEEVGGLKVAGEIARVGRSTLHRYGDDSDEHAATNIPADIAVALERHSGLRSVTEWMAAQHGCLLFCPEPTTEIPMPTSVAKIAEHASKLFHEFAVAMSDTVTPNRVDNAEAARMLKAGDDMLRVYMALRPELLARIKERV